MAVKLTSIAAAVVLADVEVFFVAFAMLALYKEKLTPLCVVGILVTFAGSVAIAAGDSAGAGGSLAGDLWALSAAFFMSIYTLMGRRCREHMSTGSYTAVVYWATALTSLLLLAVQGTPVLGYAPADIACAFGMTILCTLLGHSLFSWGLKFVSPSFISAAKLLEPVFASVLGTFFFAEIPGLPAAVGGAVVIGGIWLISRATK